jgi:hypothetical protein
LGIPELIEEGPLPLNPERNSDIDKSDSENLSCFSRFPENTVKLNINKVISGNKCESDSEDDNDHDNDNNDQGGCSSLDSKNDELGMANYLLNKTPS